MTRNSRRAFVFAATVAALFAIAAPAYANTIPTSDIPMDGTQLMKARGPIKQSDGKLALASIPQDIIDEYGQPDIVLTLADNDPAHGGTHDVPFWKMSEGTLHSDVYVGWNDLMSAPGSRQQNQLITETQVQYLAEEFDQRIWESDVFHFGNYAPRTPAVIPPSLGPENFGMRAQIFVYNIRDEAYWGDYPFYIAGFFARGINDDLGLNAIFVDSYDWANRIGPDAARPFLYEGTIAHEFEHLIHSDVDVDEDSFVDEGMADLAEQFIYGTITTDSHIGEFLVYHRDSLTDWKGELFDYGNAVLFQDYIWEQMGGDVLGSSTMPPLDGRVTPAYIGNPFANTDEKFVDPGDKYVWNLVHDQDNGLQGIADQVGGMNRVEELHRGFGLANLLDGKVEGDVYNYRNLALGGPDSAYATIEEGIQVYHSRTGGNAPPTRKNIRQAGMEPWGLRYRTIGGVSPRMTVQFSAPPTAGVSPTSPPFEWYSGLGNSTYMPESERSVVRKFEGVPTGAELSFWTWYDIEEDWDYGYVEASTNGVDFTALNQLSTLPAGVDDKFMSSAWMGPGGFTRSSGGWQQARFSLGTMSDDVWIRFHYVTDEAVNGMGWFVDDVRVGGETDSIASALGWTNKGWILTDGIQANDWTCDVFVPYAKSRGGYAVEAIVPTAGLGASGTRAVDTKFADSDHIFAVMGNRPRSDLRVVNTVCVVSGNKAK